MRTPSATPPQKYYTCSFCFKSQETGQRLVAGPSGIYICSACLTASTDALAEEKGPHGGPVDPSSATMAMPRDVLQLTTVGRDRVIPSEDATALLSPEQAATFLGVHVQTIRGYIRSGKLCAYRVAAERMIRIKRTDVLALLQPVAPGDEL